MPVPLGESHFVGYGIPNARFKRRKQSNVFFWKVVVLHSSHFLLAFVYLVFFIGSSLWSCLWRCHLLSVGSRCGTGKIVKLIAPFLFFDFIYFSNSRLSRPSIAGRSISQPIGRCASGASWAFSFGCMRRNTSVARPLGFLFELLPCGKTCWSINARFLRVWHELRRVAV